MTSSQNVTKNIKALFLLGIVLALVPGIFGAYMLAFGYLRSPGSKMPIWKFGQYTMLLGLANLFVYVCLFFQVRKAGRIQTTSPTNS